MTDMPTLYEIERFYEEVRLGTEEQRRALLAGSQPDQAQEEQAALQVFISTGSDTHAFSLPSDTE